MQEYLEAKKKKKTIKKKEFQMYTCLQKHKTLKK